MGIRIVPSNTRLPFTKYRNVGAGVSFLAVIGSIIALMTLGLNFGIDFRGGVTVEVGPAPGQVFTTDDLTVVRTKAKALGLGVVKVQTIGTPGGGGGDNIVVFVERQEVDMIGLEGKALLDAQRQAELIQTAAKDTVKVALREVLGEDISVRREDVVGPTISGELIEKGITALVIAISMMLLYIWLQFEWQFSLGAIVALVHDVILTMGFFAITQLEFNLSVIAALLTIVGYSMNDTVVVYDRVRENLRKFKKMSLTELVDLSINQTLARTVMTSVTTLLALVALAIFGGDVLRSFSLALIWGVLIGTYSSVFIASPMLIRTGVKRDWSKAVSTAVKNAP